MRIIVWPNDRDTRCEVRHFADARHTIRRTSGRADERTSGRADERTSGRADERTSGRRRSDQPRTIGRDYWPAADTGGGFGSLERATHTVLAIGRNVAALTRLRDVLSVFADDHRIRVVFTVSPGSPFADGTLELIQHFESKFVPGTRRWSCAPAWPSRPAPTANCTASARR